MALSSLIQYYADLLIIQYIGKPKAYAHVSALAQPALIPQASVQTITFSAQPTAGAFTLTWDGDTSSSIAYNASNAAIEAILDTLFGSDDYVLSGSLAGAELVVSFTGFTPPTPLLAIGTNTLTDPDGAVTVVFSQNEDTLPLAVQQAFNLTGDNLAVGVQLDTLGKYIGVTRSGFGIFDQVITLDDAEYRTLLRLATIQNSAGSSLSDIQALIDEFFPAQIYVFDYKNMQMSYLVSTTVGSFEFAQLVVTKGLLPKPMAVQLAAVIFAPVIDAFFGFRTYELEAYLSSPFNDYADYQTDWPWLSYGDAIGPGYMPPPIPIPAGIYFGFDDTDEYLGFDLGELYT